MFSIRRILGAALLFSAALPSAFAVDSLALLVIENGKSEAESAALDGGYTDTLAAEAERAFRANGIDVVRKTDEETPTETPRWSIHIHCSLAGGMLSWWFEVHDDEKGTLITADAFSAAAGLSVRDVLANSAESLAERWAASRSAEDPELPIDYRLKFISWDKGATVRLGSAEGGGKVLCVIDGKENEADFMALVVGKPISLEVTKDGYWPATLELPKGPTPETIILPRLVVKTSKALIVSWSPSRASGLAFTYRYYPLPDLLFFRTDFSPWKGSDGGEGSFPVSHIGLRLGAGLYLPFGKTANYRMSIGTGMESIWTIIGHDAELEKTSGMDILIDPLMFTLEFHLPRVALVVEQRFPFAVGGDTGFLDRGWVENGSGGMFHTSLGVMYKW